MSRFDMDYDEGIAYGLWQGMVQNALGGARSQRALALLEEALLALPEKKLVHGHLAAEGSVCTVGAFVAAHRAQTEEITVAEAVERMIEQTPCRCVHPKSSHDEAGCHDKATFWQSDEEHECSCTEYRPEHEGAHDTAEAGRRFGLLWTVAWHLAYLNDEHYADCTEEERYEKVLLWVRRALGKEPVAA